MDIRTEQPGEPSNGHVFISHSSRDAELANQLVRVLEEAEIPCWIAPRDIPFGAEYNSHLTQGIRNAAVLLLLETRHSMESDQVLREVDAAADRKIPIIPLRLEVTERSPGMLHLLRTYQWIDAFPPPIDRHFNRIIAGVQHARAQPVPILKEQTDQPEFIGSYRIMDVLGEGGMGRVFRAEQRTPIRRIVAIKRIKPGLDSKEVLARFDSERQALARMDHAHIAKVLDTGTDSLGRPYFVMEYVPGKSITDFADEHTLTIEQRLQLFIQVCQAIAHAHTKAIIHRDIKSSNVLAFMSEGKPVVKVIDFGIAKALTGDRLTDRTYATASGLAIGTYDYMSPEQANGSADIDTRTDVYSLGVLLYELLSGSKPFDSDTLRAAADAEVRRIIREVEPPRPSVRLSSSARSSQHAISVRAPSVDHVTRVLKSELEWIPLKAMRKERDRRYGSALEIIEDIQNYLQRRPLKAGPESLTYRLSKAAQRNRSLMVASTAVGMAALLGTWFYIVSLRDEQLRTSSALQRVVAEQKEKEEALSNAKAQSELAARRLEEKRAALDTLLSSFSEETLRAQAGSQAIRKRFLERALTQYQSLLEENTRDVEIIFRSCDTLKELGRLEDELGNLQASEQHLQTALELTRKALKSDGKNHRLRQMQASILIDLSRMLSVRGNAKEMLVYASDARKQLEDLLVELPNDPDVQIALANVFLINAYVRDAGSGAQPEDARAVELLTLALQARPNDPVILADLARALNSQVITAYGKVINDEAAEQVKRALELVKEAIRLRPSFGEALRRRVVFVQNLSIGWRDTNKIGAAQDLLNREVAAARSFVVENPDSITGTVALTNLLLEQAIVLKMLGRLDDALNVYREILKINELLAQRQPSSETYMLSCIDTLYLMAEVLIASKRPGEASSVYEAYGTRRKEILAGYPKSERIWSELLRLQFNHGVLLIDLGRREEAIKKYQQVIELYKQQPPCVGDTDGYAFGMALRSVFNLERLAIADGNISLAIKILESGIGPIDAARPYNAVDSKMLLNLLTNLAGHYEKLELNDKAVKTRIATMQLAQKFVGEEKLRSHGARHVILESYEPIALLYKKLKDEPRAFQALRKYMNDTEPYFWERNHSELLTATADYSPSNAERLWSTYERLAPQRTRDSTSVGDRLAGIRYEYVLEIAESWQYIEDQLADLCIGKPDKYLNADRVILRKVYDIAKENKVSFPQLVALSRVTDKNEQLLSALNTSARIQEELSAQPADHLTRLRLAEHFLEVARIMIDSGGIDGSQFYVQDAIRHADICKSQELPEPARINLIYVTADYLKAMALLRRKENELAYASLVKTLERASANTEPLSRQIMMALGQAAQQLDRPYDAANWYFQAAALGAVDSRERLTALVRSHPNVEKVYPPELRRLIQDTVAAEAEPLEPYARLARAWGKFYPNHATNSARPTTVDIPTGDPRLSAAMHQALRSISSLYLVRGRNTKGLLIYCYLKLTFKEAEEMQHAMNGTESFSLADFGEVLAAGVGEPPDELKAQMNEKFGKVVVAELEGKKATKSDVELDWEEIIKAEPPELFDKLRSRANAFAEKGQLDEVRRCADKLVETGQDQAAPLYAAARAYARCVEIAESQKRSAEFKQELIQLALKYLSASLALDTHINYAVIRSERDFNALQDLPQFKALVSP